jgi:hypothetical protein
MRLATEAFLCFLHSGGGPKFTPTMAAFHNWMIIRHPDQFMIEEDSDSEFEQAYRQAIDLQRELSRETETFLLNALPKVYLDGLIPPDIGFARRPGSRSR